MLIEFELRPVDFRVLEAWQDGKHLVVLQFVRIAWIPAMFLGGWLWTEYPYFLGLASETSAQVLLLAPALCLRLLFEFGRAIQRRRYQAATGLVEGQHSLHFSRAGVHHVSPTGIHQYHWGDFRNLEASAHYLFIRFRGAGSLVVPTEALKQFGPDYEAGFLEKLVPLFAGSDV